MGFHQRAVVGLLVVADAHLVGDHVEPEQLAGHVLLVEDDDEEPGKLLVPVA